MKTKSYKVTEKAGIYVAGLRSPGAGATIELTADQAFYPLIAQEIEEVEPSPTDPDTPTRSRKSAS